MYEGKMLLLTGNGQVIGCIIKHIHVTYKRIICLILIVSMILVQFCEVTLTLSADLDLYLYPVLDNVQLNMNEMLLILFQENV